MILKSTDSPNVRVCLFVSLLCIILIRPYSRKSRQRAEVLSHTGPELRLQGPDQEPLQERHTLLYHRIMTAMR